MRIGLIYHQFVPRGGLEGYLMEFAARLRAAGHELHVVTAEIESHIAERLQAGIHHVPVIKGSSLLRMWQFERTASRLAHEMKMDVTIGFGRTTTHDLHRAGGGCHRVYSELLSPLKKWGLKNQLELTLEKKLYASDQTKLFVVNSSQVAKQIHDVYGTDKERFRVIHTAVDATRFHPAEDRQTLKKQVCAQFKADASRPAFLFVSLNHRRKGLDVLLDLWREVDADLWIVGKPLNAAYRARLTESGLLGKVHTFAAQSNIALLYQAADWFIHPTLYDACANTVLQSMSAGLPGLISINDGAIDLVKDQENGFLLPQPQNTDDVLRVVKQALSTDEKTREKLSQAARETVRPLTWEAHVEKWMRVIDEVKT